METIKKDLLTNIGISNRMHEFTAEIIENIQKKREKLILDRLSKLGIKIDIEIEQHKRFKSLAVEYRNNEETIYYNNGTEQGMRVITFVTKQTSFDHEKMSIGCETSYY